jgi:Archaeal Type IV pilin, N-terminal
LGIWSLRKNRQGIDTILASLMMVVIVVICAATVFTYATGLFGALAVAPKTASENIGLEYAHFTANNQTVNLYIRNLGTTPITLASYYVKDSSGDQYSKTTWTGAPPNGPPSAITPGGWGNATILINSACTGCTTTGSAFTFQSGNAYTVTLVTAKNSEFVLTVIR